MATATAERRAKAAPKKFRIHLPGLDKPGSPAAAPVCEVEALEDGESCLVTWPLPQPHFWPAGDEPAAIRAGVTVPGGPGKAGACLAYNAANGITAHDKPHAVEPVA